MGPLLGAFAGPMLGSAAAGGAALLGALPTIANGGYRKRNKEEIENLENLLRGFDTQGLTQRQERTLGQSLTDPGIANLENAMSFQGSVAGPSATGLEFSQQLAQQAAKSSLIGQLGAQAQAQVMAADEYEKAKQEAEKRRLENELEMRYAFKTQANKDLMAAWLAMPRATMNGMADALGVEQDVGEGGQIGARQSAVPSGWEMMDYDPQLLELLGSSSAGVA